MSQGDLLYNHDRRAIHDLKYLFIMEQKVSTSIVLTLEYCDDARACSSEGIRVYMSVVREARGWVKFCYVS